MAAVGKNQIPGPELQQTRGCGVGDGPIISSRREGDIAARRLGAGNQKSPNPGGGKKKSGY